MDRQILYRRRRGAVEAEPARPAGPIPASGRPISREMAADPRSAWPLWLALGLAAAWAPAALANEAVVADPIQQEAEGPLEQVEEDAQLARSYGELVEVRLFTGSEFVIGSDFDEFKSTSYQPGGRVKLTLPVADNAALRVVARGSALLYDFDDVWSNLFGGAPSNSDPFGTLYATSLQIQGGVRPDWTGLFSEEERWSFVGETAVRARWEEGARFTQALSVGGALGVGYQIGKWLQLIVGVGVTSRLDGSPSVRPVFDLDWRFAERWRLRTRGRGAQIEYDLDDDLTLFANGQMESRSYLMEDRGAGIGEGRLRDSSVPVGLGVRWDVSPMLELSLTGGAVLRHELRTKDEDGDDLGHARSGPTPFLGVTLELQPERGRRVAKVKPIQRAAGAGSSSTSISTSR